MDPKILAGLIATFVSLIGVTVSYFSAKHAVGTKMRELDIKVSELEIQIEKSRQDQLNEVLKKRIETYGEFYRIISEYGRNWQIMKKPRDMQWISQFLDELLKNNAENGVYFSNEVYRCYGDLRNLLVQLRDKFESGASPDENEINKMLYDIIRGKDGGPGLGSWLKDDLGSYVSPIISNVHLRVRSEKPRGSRVGI